MSLSSVSIAAAAAMSLFLLSLVATPSLGGGTTIELVKDGQPSAVIVLPGRTEFEQHREGLYKEIEKQLRASAAHDEQALPVAVQKAVDARLKTYADEELLAAEELQSIVQKISGATLPIHRSGADGPATGTRILLGAELARGAGLGDRIDGLDKDGLLCTTLPDGSALVLTGRRGRGTLYAAYEFLESLGCRWVMPGAFGEIYPSMTSISTEIDRLENPSHSQRYFWCPPEKTADFPRWNLRNKGNYLQTIGDHYVHQQHTLGAPLAWGAQQEKWRVPGKVKVSQPRIDEGGQPIKDEAGNPVMETVEKDGFILPEEHFAIMEGKPTPHTPNFSNPKTWELYADYYIDHFNRHPDEKYASMSAEDGLVIDERPESRRLMSHDFDFAMGAPSATDSLWFFLNRVIDQVTKVHPDKRFGVLVYANNLAPPRLERVHPNMALIFAPLGICPQHQVRDENCKTNRAYNVWLQDWMIQAKAAGAETYYYDYEPTGYCWNMAMICPRWGTIGANYPYFHQLGLDGHMTQGFDDWASSGLNNYLMQRLYWDVDEDYREIIADYSKARFGAAADAMIEYYTLLERRVAEAPELYSNESWANHLVLTPEVRAKARSVLESALARADTDVAKAHVQTMIDLQRSTDAACNAIEHADATGDFAKAAEMMQPIWEVRDKLNAIYPNFMNIHRLDDKATAEYLTGGIFNQYKKFGEKIETAKASLMLPRIWKGMLDTGNRATALGYHKPETSVDKLDNLDVTLCPDVVYGTHTEVAAFFYRTNVDVPATFEGTKTSIFFPSVIAKGLQIWVNGESVEFDNGTYKDTIWRGPNYFWISYDHSLEFDITRHLKPGQPNTIAFRVFKSFNFGGSYRRVVLLGN